MKINKKTDKTVTLVENKGKETKENNTFSKGKDDAKTIKKMRLMNLTLTQ